MRRIKRVKHHGGKTTVEWHEPNGNHQHLSALVDCPDEPNRSFLDAMEAVELVVLKMLGITGKSFANAFQFTGITISENVHGRRQFKPSAYITSAYGGGFGCSLPIMSEAFDDEDGVHLLSDVAMKTIEKFLEEGAAYSAQARVQTSLGLDSTGTD